MSITIRVDDQTYAVLDDAIAELADRREVSLATDDGLLSILASIDEQVHAMLEEAIAEADIGHTITAEDIAEILGISPSEARRRYQPHGS